MGFWGTAFSAGVGAFLSVLAAKFIEHLISNSDGLERLRDEDQKLIEKFANEIRDKAIAYWATPDAGGSLKIEEAAITGRLVALGGIISRVFGEHPELKKAVDLELNRYDDAITNGNFGVTGRAADPNKASDIEIAAYALTDKAVVCRRKLPRKFLRR